MEPKSSFLLATDPNFLSSGSFGHPYGRAGDWLCTRESWHIWETAISKSTGVFIAKDMKPYSVVEKEGFKHMINVLMPRRYAYSAECIFLRR